MRTDGPSKPQAGRARCRLEVPPVVCSKEIQPGMPTAPSSKTEQYYTPELLKRVKKAYAMDYEMLESINALGSEPTTGAAWSADLNAKQKLWHFDRGFYDARVEPPESKCPGGRVYC